MDYSTCKECNRSIYVDDDDDCINPLNETVYCKKCYNYIINQRIQKILMSYKGQETNILEIELTNDIYVSFGCFKIAVADKDKLYLSNATFIHTNSNEQTIKYNVCLNYSEIIKIHEIHIIENKLLFDKEDY